MKTRKRDRSPSADCDECMPISKRITRLNIQAASRCSLDDKDQGVSGQSSQACSSAEIGQTSPGAQFPWQQANGSTIENQQRLNNNQSYPSGSNQCDRVQNVGQDRNSLHVYASHNGLPVNDFQGYKPELNQVENPHYYQINSLLYGVHLEKANRQAADLKP